jgi:hypothetical protein
MSGTFSLASTAAELEAHILNNRLLSVPVDWKDEIVFPNYNGLSLVNIANSIAHLFDVSIPNNVPLDDRVWDGQSLPGTIDRVVFFLTDGLGYRFLQQLMANDTEIHALVSELTDGRGPLPLTSTVPSTTATALPTLWTGRTPAEHGMLGTRLFLRELGMSSDILFFKPNVGKHLGGILSDWGLEPDNFVPVQSLGQHLNAVGVPTQLLLPKSLLFSGLSLILHRGISQPHQHAGYTDLWPRLHEILQETTGQRCYVSIYWPAVDTLSHMYGAHHPHLLNEIKSQFRHLRDILADTNIHDGRTLVMIGADHGHHNTAELINLSEDEAARLIKQAIYTIGAEARLRYLYVRGNQVQTVKDAIDQNYVDKIAYLDSQEALAAGLFGPQSPYDESQHRIGDLILIPRLNTSITDHISKVDAISQHGGLSEHEMLVPFMWRHL